MDIKKGDMVRHDWEFGHVYFKVLDYEWRNGVLYITAVEVDRIELCDGECESNA